MKKIVVFFILTLPFLRVNAQSLMTETEWKNVITCLKNEDWQKSNDLSKAYLEKIQKHKTDEEAAAILRYMYIISEAGLMNARKLTKEEALKNVIDFTGHNIILAGHPVVVKPGFNSVQMVNNKTDTLFITATNSKATDIFSFEYIIPKNPISISDFRDHDGKICRIGGRIKSIKVEGVGFPRFRIIIDQGILAFD